MIFINQQVYLFAALALTTCIIGLSAAQANIIKLNLNKQTSPQAGFLGQPVTNYFTKIGVGTPAKDFKMLVDVNAKETWVPHSLTLSAIYNRLHYSNGYSKKGSSSSVKEDRGNSYTFEYQGCKLSGKAYEDVFNLRDANRTQKQLSVKQRFLAISSSSNDRLSGYPIDGVLELNPSLTTDLGSTSILVNLKQAKLIDDMKFSFWFNTNQDTEEGGELTLGGIDPLRYIGDVRYHPLTAVHDRWETNLQAVWLGGQVVSGYRNSSTAIISTGVNDLYGPPEDVEKIMALLGVTDVNKRKKKVEKNDKEAGQLFEIECLRVVDLPALTFTIDGLSYVVKPSSYIKKKVDGYVFKSSTCYVTIIAHSSPNQWILGTNFLSNYYSVFDPVKRQLGLATPRF